MLVTVWLLIICVFMKLSIKGVKEVKRVAVIGAGAAGLAFGSVSQEHFNVRIFEATDSVGGVWNYRRKLNGPAMPMYSGLVTNLPKTIMQYSDSDVFVGEPSRSFATHAEVQSYLEDFSVKHKVTQLIDFNTKVTRVRKTDDAWEVERYCDEEFLTDEFDAVVICNGHYAKASYPDIPGRDLFQGKVLHSIDYDTSMCEEMKGKNVLVLGARASATDIARELSIDSTVIVADRGLNKLVTDETRGTIGSSHGSLRHRSGVTQISGTNTVEFYDGQTAEIDVIIWCTGYDYNFEFLSEDMVSDTNRSVRPLYQHVFHADEPTLAFVGLPHSVVPFPLFQLQSEWITAVLKGDCSLPDHKERHIWLQEFEQNLKDRGGWPRDYHYMGTTQWDYCKWIASQYNRLDDKLSLYIDTNKAIYDNNKAHMPMYPGGPDDYRRRIFSEVDRSKVTFSVHD